MHLSIGGCSSVQKSRSQPQLRSHQSRLKLSNNKTFYMQENDSVAAVSLKKKTIYIHERDSLLAVSSPILELFKRDIFSQPKLNLLKVKYPELQFVQKKHLGMIRTILDERDKECFRYLNELSNQRKFELLSAYFTAGIELVVSKFNELSKHTSQHITDNITKVINGFFTSGYRQDVLKKLGELGIRHLYFDLDDTLTKIHSNHFYRRKSNFDPPIKCKPFSIGLINDEIICLLFWLKNNRFKLRVATNQERGIAIDVLAKFHLSWMDLTAGASDKSTLISSMDSTCLLIDDTHPKEEQCSSSVVDLRRLFRLMKIKKGSLSSYVFRDKLDQLQPVVFHKEIVQLDPPNRVMLPSLN